jgi:hypothetical protein
MTTRGRLRCPADARAELDRQSIANKKRTIQTA